MSALAVVTGAGGGIGEQIAAGLARTRATAVLVDLDRTRLDLREDVSTMPFQEPIWKPSRSTSRTSPRYSGSRR
ncbi:hypothetical protein [Actinomadura sp. 9N407]|uniref:hypothetical protein n=1 Tax=Actinomadura sp. 9N407 TaxID=3375154 RepID=UPI0037B098EC